MATPLQVPNTVTPNSDVIAAALAYTTHGWWVLPVAPGSKNPGSIVGHSWHTKSVQTKHDVLELFTGLPNGAGLALHAGKSGAIILDVDHPDQLPEWLADAINDAPRQLTRRDDTSRGHYIFTQPAGKTIGNGLGDLPAGWGDIRGLNGVIIAAPSSHPADDGHYKWHTTGLVPVLPASIADRLNPATPAGGSATDTQIATFLTAHTTGNDLHMLAKLENTYRRDAAAGEGRHHRMNSVLTGAMREAKTGHYPAATAVERLKTLWMDTITVAGIGKQGAARTSSEATREFTGMLVWAVGQALTADDDATRQRVAAHDVTITASTQPPAPLTPPPPAVAAVEPALTQSGDATEELPPSSWDRVDLIALLQDDDDDEIPTAGERSDGACMFYPGKTNVIIGRSESGKTWLAYQSVKQYVEAGGGAVILDFEDAPKSYKKRMRSLGLSDYHIGHHTAYVKPEIPSDPTLWLRIQQSLDYVNHSEDHPALVIVDGMNFFMVMHGSDPNSNRDVADFQQRFLNPLTDLGGITVAIDHTGKNQLSKGAIGAQAKRAFLTGAGILVEPVQSFGKGKKGWSRLVIDKDRPGEVRGSTVEASDGADGVFGWVYFDSDVDGNMTVDISTVEPVTGDEKGSGQSPDRRIEEQILEFLNNAVGVQSKNKIRQAVTGKSVAIDAVVDRLVEDGSLVADTSKSYARFTVASAQSRQQKQAKSPTSTPFVPSRPDDPTTQPDDFVPGVPFRGPLGDEVGYGLDEPLLGPGTGRGSSQAGPQLAAGSEGGGCEHSWLPLQNNQQVCTQCGQLEPHTPKNEQNQPQERQNHPNPTPRRA